MYEQQKTKLIPAVRVDNALWRALHREAKKHKVPYSQIVRAALKSHLGER